MSSLVNRLLELKAGDAKCVLGIGLDDVCKRLLSLPPDLHRPIVLLRQIDAIPSTSQLINDVLLTLATTARNLWPVWFTDVDFGLGVSGADRAAVRSRIGQLSPPVAGLSATWAREAATRALSGHLPLFAKMA